MKKRARRSIGQTLRAQFFHPYETLHVALAIRKRERCYRSSATRALAG